jgi:K+-sensing histidine kinase KdpD
MSPKTSVAASLAATLAVAWMDYATGLQLEFSAFYILPVLLAAWFAGRRWAAASALVNTMAWSVVDHLAGHFHPNFLYALWEFLDHALVYLLVAVAVGGLRAAIARQKSLNLQLSQALEEVGELKGLLPVCAWCHKVRDDRGYWGQLETYIEARTQASFTHGICPDCQARVMAERIGNTGEQPVLPIPPPRSPSR